MQSNASLIKKLMMHSDFIGKNLYSVVRAKLSSKSVVILTLVHEVFIGVFSFVRNFTTAHEYLVHVEFTSYGKGNNSFVCKPDELV